MKKVLIIIGLIAIAIGILGTRYYLKIYSPNTAFSQDYKILLVYVDYTYEEVKTQLIDQKVIDDVESFDWVSEKKNYPNKVKPGRYRFSKGMNNNEIVNLLRSGIQAPIMVTFNNVRNFEEFSGKVSVYFEKDSIDFLEYLKEEATAQSFGFDQSTFASMFIPNTYEMFWTTSPEGFSKRMASEWKAYWNESRLNKAKVKELSQSEVTTLASIVKAECSHLDEAPRVAGVYLNRINRGIALQADPTLIFALGDFSITRVLNWHKEIDSPYNTYKYPGLPPGPINFPEPAYLDAVLNAEKHDFIYFCAKSDFSGYHNFSKSYNQHLVYAREYQRELNKRRIYE